MLWIILLPDHIILVSKNLDFGHIFQVLTHCLLYCMLESIHNYVLLLTFLNQMVLFHTLSDLFIFSIILIGFPRYCRFCPNWLRWLEKLHVTNFAFSFRTNVDLHLFLFQDKLS